ncbi:MAG TPA: hypothetical protein DDZ68_09030 [Parvularcula sp.]|nr:hypothetical protein [Parvularcula sp.]HBS31311.1 hypothetical protein [Parvularcula sp.]HBS34370.1 hypothetical protein [Parvularcula sp.]
MQGPSADRDGRIIAPRRPSPPAAWRDAALRVGEEGVDPWAELSPRRDNPPARKTSGLPFETRANIDTNARRPDRGSPESGPAPMTLSNESGGPAP